MHSSKRIQQTVGIVLSGALSVILTACGNAQQSSTQQQTAAPAAVVSQLKQTKVAEALEKMSLADKITLVSGVGMYLGEGKQGEYDKVPGTAGYTYPIASAGLHSIALADGPAGLRIWPTREGEEGTFYATAFPVASLVASTWDVNMAQQVGQAMGHEVKEYGVDVLLAPGMNIHRNPLGGRNFEYFSEDPVLSGHMAGAVVNGIESNGVGATIKHFVANSQETNRMSLDTIVSERALRELYLKGFRIAIEESDPWAVMSAYNLINGQKSSEHAGLLTDVLREEWGYQGLVMTDWFAGTDPALQLNAGNDLLMPGMAERTELLKTSIENGDITEQDIDINVTRIVNMILKTPSQNGYQYSNSPDLKKNAKIARDVAAEGVVLLKNENKALPLSSEIKSVGAFGVGSYAFIAGGVGSGDVNEAYTVSLVEGLKNANIKVDSELQVIYHSYREVEKAKLPEKDFFFALDAPIPEMPLDASLLSKVVERTDTGLITIGRNSGEFVDRYLDGDFYLTDAEKQMISQVSDAYHAADKKVIVVLNIGNVIEMLSWQNKPDAIVLPWQGGQEAGNALTDVLLGKVNPSGRLPTTFPVKYGDVPSSAPKLFPGTEEGDADPIVIIGIEWGKPGTVWYEEGIFVGYRYYDTFNVDVAYPFGYGLSYTSFAITSPIEGKTIENSAEITIPVIVKNTGKTAGKQVVQLYVAPPQGNLPKPNKELKAFAKTKLLAPGESETLTLQVSRDQLASFYPEQDAWVLDKGIYTFEVATNINNVVLSGTLNVPQREITEKVKANLEPESPLVELSN